MMQLITMFPWDGDSTFKSGYVSEVGTTTTLEAERQRRIIAWKGRLHLASFDSAWQPEVDRYHTTGFVSVSEPHRHPHPPMHHSSITAGLAVGQGGERDLEPAAPPVLDELGEKLLGLHAW